MKASIIPLADSDLGSSLSEHAERMARPGIGSDADSAARVNFSSPTALILWPNEGKANGVTPGQRRGILNRMRGSLKALRIRQSAEGFSGPAIRSKIASLIDTMVLARLPPYMSRRCAVEVARVDPDMSYLMPTLQEMSETLGRAESLAVVLSPAHLDQLIQTLSLET